MNTENQKCTIISKFVIRSKTNYGEFCKQYFIVVGRKGSDTSLIIEKNVLVEENFKIYEEFGFDLIKKCNKSRLYRQVFSIKLSTLSEVVKCLNKIK